MSDTIPLELDQIWWIADDISGGEDTYYKVSLLTDKRSFADAYKDKECTELVMSNVLFTDDGLLALDERDWRKCLSNNIPKNKKVINYNCSCGIVLSDLQPDEKACWKCGAFIVQ